MLSINCVNAAKSICIHCAAGDHSKTPSQPGLVTGRQSCSCRTSTMYPWPRLVTGRQFGSRLSHTGDQAVVTWPGGATEMCPAGPQIAVCRASTGQQLPGQGCKLVLRGGGDWSCHFFGRFHGRLHYTYHQACWLAFEYTHRRGHFPRVGWAEPAMPFCCEVCTVHCQVCTVH